LLVSRNCVVGYFPFQNKASIALLLVITVEITYVCRIVLLIAHTALSYLIYRQVNTKKTDWSGHSIDPVMVTDAVIAKDGG
jgi:hypothetical protein